MADDDRIVRRIVVAKLSGLGYDLTQAEDGQEALRLLEDGFVPDLVITDSLMPRMTGLELARSIRNSPNADVAKLPIIMLTSRQGARRHRGPADRPRRLRDEALLPGRVGRPGQNCPLAREAPRRPWRSAEDWPAGFPARARAPTLYPVRETRLRPASLAA